jgi:hypothetical protein
MSGGIDDGGVDDDGADVDRCRAFKIRVFSSSFYWLRCCRGGGEGCTPAMLPLVVDEDACSCDGSPSFI